MNNPAFAGGVEDILAAGGRASFVYGKTLTKERAEKFLAESGLSAEEVKKIGLIEKTRDGKLDSLEKEIEACLPDGYSINHTAIVIAPGELEGVTSKAKVLELKAIEIRNKKVVLALNAERVAYRIALRNGVPSESMALDNEIHGLYYDAAARRFLYLPPMVPQNIVEEAETFRQAMLLLSSAA